MNSKVELPSADHVYSGDIFSVYTHAQVSIFYVYTHAHTHTYMYVFS